MGKLKSFYISFNENKEVFFPGDFISGSVCIVLDAPMDMRAVKLKFHGKAFVRWTERHGSGKNRRSVTYRGQENYFEQSIVLYGQGSGSTDGQKKLPAGQSVFPFNFQLPGQLPSSFEGRHGHVRYFVKASIDKPWKFDHNSKRAFTVLDVVDLNHDPTARNTPTASDSKVMCCLCCASGPIQAQVHLDRTGYVPGELMLISANVENLSNSDLPGTHASLIQKVTFRATRKSRTVTNEVAKINGPGIGRGKTLEWNNERLQVPALPPSLLRYCNIIIINYFLQFCVELPGTSINLRVNVPVTLGSVPLQGLTPYNMPPPASFATAPEPSAPLPPPSAPPAYAAPPPSYQAAVGASFNIADDDDNEHLMGEMSFAPRYAYYDWNQSAFTYNK